MRKGRRGGGRRKGGGERTISDYIANHIDEIFLVLGLAIVFPEQSSEMSQDGVGLGEDLAVELYDGNVGCWVHG